MSPSWLRDSASGGFGASWQYDTRWLTAGSTRHISSEMVWFSEHHVSRGQSGDFMGKSGQLIGDASHGRHREDASKLLSSINHYTEIVLGICVHRWEKNPAFCNELIQNAAARKHAL
jgi:hypothetical protein